MRRLQPSSGIVPIDFEEVWRFRSLLYRLLWRDIKARYKQTLLGPVWAILRPVVLTSVFTTVLHKAGGLDGPEGVPYQLYVFSGLLCWMYFASALTGSSGCLLSYGGMLGKAYFPRVYAPFAAITAPLVDMVLALPVIFLLFLNYHRWPSWHLIFLPFFILLTAMAALGLGIWLAGLSVRYRDIGFTLPFAISVGMWITPVAITLPVMLASFPSWLHPLIKANPITVFVEAFRWSLLGVKPPDVSALAISACAALVLAIVGLYYFKRTERTIVDHL
jgi:homopolymeric O-antigen transport system permease protein